MCLRHLLLAGLLGGMLAACGSPSEPSSATHVMGSVLDTAFRPLRGARVEIIDGPFAGMIKIADAHGIRIPSPRQRHRDASAEQDGLQLNRPRIASGTARTGRPSVADRPRASITPGSYTLTVG